MWTATYKNIDKSGLGEALIVSVDYSDGTTTYSCNYTVMPQDIDSPDLTAQIQNQVDILNAKDTAVTKTTVIMLNQPVILTPPLLGTASVASL